jgi:Tfp pilus assembly protein PilN
MAAADVAQVRAQVRTCRRAGLAVEAVEPVLLACARTFLRDEGEARYRRDVLVAVLGAEHLALCLFSKGMLDFVRIREIPGDANALEPLCQWLAQELRAVRQYEEMKNSEGNRESVMKLVVHDSGHPPQEVERLLAAQMGRERLTVVGTCHTPGASAACEKPASMAAVGAALGLLEARPDEPKINLLPEEVTRTRRFSRHLLVTANAAALVFLGLLLLIQVVTRATAAAREKIEQTRVSNQLAVTPALVAQEKLLEQEISRVQEQRQRLQVAHPRQDVDWPGVLKAVRAVAPAGVCITDLSCSDSRNLALRGMALSGAAAREFVRGLEGGRVFESVVLARLERQQDSAGLMQYQIDCLLNPAP